MPDDGKVLLATVVGTEAADALQHSARSRNREVDLAEPLWTAAGHTGAVLAAVVEVSTPPAPQRPDKYIVKVCPADGLRREGARHHAALALSTADFTRRHLVDVAGAPILLHDGGELLLQRIADDSLARCRSMSGNNLDECVLTATQVVSALLGEWTGKEHLRLDTLTVADYLARELVDEVCDRIELSAAWIEPEGEQTPLPLANPLAMLRGSVGGRVQYLAGFTHGDLHEDNVLVPRVDGVVRHDAFRLIDLTTFDEAGPLSRDLAMLTVSAVTRRLGGCSPAEAEALLHYVVDRTAERAIGAPVGLRAYVDAVRYADRPLLAAAEFDENWSDQLLLSLVAAAMRHLSFEDLGEDARWWSFRLAAHAASAFLSRRGTAAPERGRAVGREMITTPINAAPPGPGPETTAGVLPIGDGYRRSLMVVSPADDPDDTVATATRAFNAIGYHCDDVIPLTDADQVRKRIAARLAGAGSTDIVAIYLAGTVEPLDNALGGLVVHTSRSHPGTSIGAMPLVALLEGLWQRPAGAPAAQLLLVLDTQGADVTAVVHAATSVRVAASSLCVVAATTPAGSGRFAGCLTTVLTGVEVAPRDKPYLDVRQLAERLRSAVPPGSAVQTAEVSDGGRNICLPNPRHHLVGVDPHEMTVWWEPTARASRGAAAPQAWFFSGRRRLNQRVARWIADPADPVLVLTGSPGSGKSTIMARLVVATVPDVREHLRSRPEMLRPDESPPADFRFVLTLRLTGRTFEQVRVSLAAAVAAEGQSQAGSAAGVIAIDGLDEADQPHRIVAELLRPMAQRARAGGTRLLVATRRHPVGHDPDDPGAPRGDLITSLTSDGGEALDIGEPPWLEAGDIAEYCDRLLTVAVNDRGRPNIYAGLTGARRVLARAIETQARHSFLLAAHVARRHTLDGAPADSLSPAWRRQFPRGIGDAMRQEVEALYGVDEADRQLALLRPLAYAQGSGLTREPAAGSELWAVLASRLDPDGRSFTAADVRWLLDQRIATHLVTGVDIGGIATYRFHHEALAASFLADRADRAAAHLTITEALLDTLVAGGARDWTRAGAYTRRALPAHARLAGTLERLAEDAQLLMYSDPDRLHEALVTSDSPRLVAVSRLLRPYLHRLRAATPAGRGFLLSVAATVMDRPGLSAALAAAAGLPVAVRHVRVRHEALRQSIAEGTPVRALDCVVDRDDNPLVVLANGQFLDVRDPESGALVETVLSGSAAVTSVVGYVDEDGFPVVGAAGAEGGVRVWDATTRALRAESPVDLRRGMVLGRGRDGSVLLAGWTEEQVSVWRPGSAAPPLVLPVRWEAGRQPITGVAVTCDADGADLVAVAAGGRVTVWEPTTGHERYAVDLEDSFNIQIVALQPGTPDGRLLITAGLRERETLLWRPSTGAYPWPWPEAPVCVAADTNPETPTIVLGYLSGAVDTWDGDERSPARRLLDAGLSVHAVYVGPPGSARPVLVSIDRVGRIRLWERSRGRDAVTLTGSAPHAVAMGSLRQGGRYLVVGRNDGADLWRIDEVSQDPEAADLHDGDAEQIVADPASGYFATVGDDGRVSVWSTRSGGVLGALPIPTGAPFAAVGWAAGGTGRLAVTTSTLLLVTDLRPGVRPLLQREMEAPGRIAVLDDAGTVLLAVADRHRVWLVAPDSGDADALETPETAPDGQRLSAAARNVVSLTWMASGGAYLVAGTQGGVLARWSRREGCRPEPMTPLAGDLGIVLVTTAVPGGAGSRVLVGGHVGVLRIYDTHDGTEVFDLTRDDGRVIAAAVVDTVPPVAVTAHLFDEKAEVRVWNTANGRLLRSVVHPARRGDVFVGPPQAGRTAAGRPFVVYVVEDGVELLWLDHLTGDEEPMRLLLPFTVRDVAAQDGLLFIAGGGGFLTLALGASEGEGR
ncbi:hypothetical protein ABZU25_06585 [Micromonospora sp. NPDC005215]|uniref:hypothetical protein n=1 Tax=Micromonospora sp. NPDC005215 TaxID=3157024 RepID=UPI0033B12112